MGFSPTHSGSKVLESRRGMGLSCSGMGAAGLTVPTVIIAGELSKG